MFEKKLVMPQPLADGASTGREVEKGNSSGKKRKKGYLFPPRHAPMSSSSSILSSPVPRKRSLSLSDRVRFLQEERKVRNKQKKKGTK